MACSDLKVELHNWAKAPYDATHFGPDSKSYSACYYKKVDGVWYFAKTWCGSKNWHPMGKPPSKFRFGKMIKRPQWVPVMDKTRRH